MDPETAKGWLEILRDLGLGFTAALALVLWGLYTGKLRWERDVLKCEKESTEWRHAADSGTAVLEKATKAIERTTAALDLVLDRIARLEQRAR